MTQNHKATEQPERNRRQQEEIDCRDTIDMIGQKGSPPLGRRAAIHIARDRRLSERETEPEQFTMNVWCTHRAIERFGVIHHGLSSVAFITTIAESNFRYAQDQIFG